MAITKPTSKKRKPYGKRQKTYHWDWQTRLNAEQYIENLIDILESPLDSMEQNNGDILVSELQQLITGLYRIRNRNENRG
jgi:hypothetical protein